MRLDLAVGRKNLCLANSVFLVVLLDCIISYGVGSAPSARLIRWPPSQALELYQIQASRFDVGCLWLLKTKAFGQHTQTTLAAHWTATRRHRSFHPISYLSIDQTPFIDSTLPYPLDQPGDPGWHIQVCVCPSISSSIESTGFVIWTVKDVNASRTLTSERHGLYPRYPTVPS